MALEQEGECHIVEGYVVEHSLLLKSRSVGYLSEMAAAAATAEEAGATTTTTSTTARPPKISVTLSEYLSAGSPNPDPSCDFGWFTPTASAASASSLAPAAFDSQESYFPAPPSPSSNHPTSFLFPSTSVESSAKTAAMSPESVAFGSVGDGGNSWRCSCKEAPAAPPPAATSSGGGGGGGPRQVSFRSNGMTSSQEPASAVPNDQLGHRRPARASSSSSEAGRRTSSMADAGEDGSIGGGGMGMRLLPVARSRSTTTHLNSWHTLYPGVSNSGKLSAALLGRCTLHLRRTSFPISTRHFPGRPPTPRARALGTGRGGGNGSSCSSSSSSSSSNSNSKREGTPAVAAAKAPNGPPLVRGSAPAQGAAASQQHQQRQDCGAGGSKSGSSGGGSGGGGGGPRKSQQQQSCSWAITEIRVVKPSVGAPFAQYLVAVCMGREKLVAGWRRASDFEKLARVARRAWMSKAAFAWEALECARRHTGGGPCNIPLVLRPRRLDAPYLQNKARFLEEFLKQFFFEAGSKEALLSFLDTSKPATMEIG